MAKNSDLQKHTLNLYAGDFDRLAEFYPDIPAATIVRKLVRRYIEQVEASGSASINPTVEISL